MKAQEQENAKRAAAAHTAGPWRIDGKNRLNETIVAAGNSVEKCCFIGSVYGEANARLIAAAPEMLEALRMVAELNPYAPNATKIFAAQEQAKLVIAKAMGGAL